MDKPHLIVIGGGFTGCAIALDAGLRGFQVTVLERGELASGTSGRTHGHLHSGARYCVVDPNASRECIEENTLLRKMAPGCVEWNGGLAILIREEDRDYEQKFVAGAQACHIEIEKFNREQLLQMEPNLTPKVMGGYRVPDGTFDPLRLALAFAATAKKKGADFRSYHEAAGFLRDGQGNVDGVEVWDRLTDTHYSLKGDMVVNATGAWAGKIAALAHLKVSVTPTPGVMVAYDQRFVNHLIQRLGIPGDGDAILPQRRMVVMGTTSFETEDIDYIPVYKDHLREMHEAAIKLIPAVANANMRGAFISARPLIGSESKGRSVSRTFVCYDHQANDGIKGIITITGGKATTCRAMAEKAVDMVCQSLGMSTACTTREVVLSSYRDYYRN
jgi:glycerol-3-phosphate dehydrogenase